KELDLIQTYSVDILKEMANNQDLVFVIPEEGSTFTLDNLVVLKGGRNPDLALKFINYLYRPDVCAKNMNAVMYVAPNPMALQLVDKSLRDKSAFTIAETYRAKREQLLDLGESNVLF
ncbi:MAG: extracellular solute-binding protein, partial [Planctomycetes bacterium]|nr:extracellular solute-binding protein [Planctomycetota bacterium]